MARQKGKQEYPRQCVCGTVVGSAYVDSYDGHWMHEDQQNAYRLGYRAAPYVFVAFLALVFVFGFAVLGPIWFR